MTGNMQSINSLQSVWIGKWSYRSFYNIADLSADLNSMLLGEGTIRIDPTPMPNQMSGLIYGPGWQLDLTAPSITETRSRFVFRVRAWSAATNGFTNT